MQKIKLPLSRMEMNSLVKWILIDGAPSRERGQEWENAECRELTQAERQAAWDQAKGEWKKKNL